MKIADIARIIEAVVFVSGDGVDRDEFKRLYDLSDKELNKCLDILKAKYNEDSGINIITYKNKIQFCSNPELVDKVAEILNPIRERSLTKSALETIAIIAYKQPITRSEIEQIRGTSSDYAMQLLQSNNLIEVVGRKDTVGKPLLFGTTETFLKRFELESLDALPNHKELLDRIRVIHSDGDSLYREFDIPDEEKGENAEGENPNNISTAEGVETAELDNNLSVEENGAEMVVPSAENGEHTEILTENTKPKRKKAKVVEVASETAEDIKVEQEEEPQSVKSKPKKASKKVSTDLGELDVMQPKEVVDQNSAKSMEEVKEVIEQPQTANDKNAEDKPKLSWRDKMKAKMAENAEHYENLDNVMERKQ